MQEQEEAKKEEAIRLQVQKELNKSEDQQGTTMSPMMKSHLARLEKQEQDRKQKQQESYGKNNFDQRRRDRF